MATLRRSRVRFRERAELLDFLLEVSTLTSETLDLDALLDNVAGIIHQVIPHELFAILLWSERRKRLRIRHSRGHRNEVVANLEIAGGEGLTGKAALTRQPVMSGDVLRDPNYINALDAVHSELAVPMIVHQKLVGVIDLQSTAEHAFTPQDRALLQLIAARVGSAIENARLYRRVERQNKTQRTLAALAQEFSAILRLDDLLDKIAKSVRTLIPYDAFLVLLVDEEQRLMRARYSLRYDERTQQESLHLGMGITGAAAQAKQPVLVRDTSADSRYIETNPGIRSELAIPLIVHDRVIGVLDLESARVGAFVDEHVRTLMLLAPPVAIAIENARLYEEVARREEAIRQDLKAAQKVQHVLMPEEPKATGLEVAARLRPARTITGDLYDFFEYDDEHTLIAFGDSAGKGAAAALFGAMFSGLLRSLAPRRRGPAMLLKALNETLMERQVHARYVTLMVMLWQAGERTFTVANAGSTPPLVIRQGKILEWKIAGVPVGLLEAVEYDEMLFQAEHGDLIVLYSDGIQDQQNNQCEEYARRRLPEFILSVMDEPAKEIVKLLLDDVKAYRGAMPVHDDQTVVVLRVD